MKYIVFLKLLFLCLLSTVSFGQARPFWNEIRAFHKLDSISFPPEGVIVFTGSSSFRMWKDVDRDFPGYMILNRAFGGSTLPQLTMYADDIVYKYKPRQVVIYSGENDIAEGVSAGMVLERFKEFFTSARAKIPRAVITYVSMKPSPSREKYRAEVETANSLIRAYLKKFRRTSFVDVYTKMLGPGKTYRNELFLKDNLHMNSTGYAIWQAAIAPYLIKQKKSG